MTRRNNSLHRKGGIVLSLLLLIVSLCAVAIAQEGVSSAYFGRALFLSDF
jgi:hypothetical protein